MAAYEDALSRCSTEHAPWFIIPADHKWFRNLAVARIVVEYLEGLKMTFPPPAVDIEHIRKEYHSREEEEPLLNGVPLGANAAGGACSARFSAKTITCSGVPMYPLHSSDYQHRPM